MKKLIAAFLSLALTLPLAAPTMAAGKTASFQDVPASSWAYSYVEQAVSNGWVLGVGNGHFSPDGKVTYAQFAVMVSNAFFSEQISPNPNVPWYQPYMQTVRENGVFKGTAAQTSDSPAGQALTRYEMAQICAALMKQRGTYPTVREINAAQDKIADYSCIPFAYQDAVSACYAKGVISGLTNGSFGGSSSMTRAQACVVLTKLWGLASSRPTPSQSLTAQEGYLTNGKPITQANVLELLAQLEDEYPTETVWSRMSVSGTMYNPNSVSDTVQQIVREKYSFDTKYSCGGFAAMVSDRLFGLNANPLVLLANEKDVRPGDIIVRMTKKGNVDYVMIAVGTAEPVDIPNGAKGYYGTDPYKVNTARGDDEGVVSWPSFRNENRCYFTNGSVFPYEYAIYSRYPDAVAAPPETPAAPTQPEKPATPAQPETPSAPVQPEKPATPAQPEKPATPAQPEKPATPAQPEIPPVYESPEDIPSYTPPAPTLANGAEITEDNVRAIINSLRSEYPEGMRWTNADYYRSNISIRGWGCEAFGLLCSDAAFGNLRISVQHSDFSAIRAGDILRINNDGHTVVVLEKKANSVIVTEGNYNESIHWDREITRQSLEKGNYFVRTRYPDLYPD